MADLSITASEVKLVSGTTKLAAVLNAVTAGQVLVRGSGLLFQSPIEVVATQYRVQQTMQDLATFSFLAHLGVGLGIALSNASSGQNTTMTQPGCIIGLGVSTTNNQLYFVSSNIGGICPYADQLAGLPVVILGIGLGGTRFLFQPIITGLKK